MYDNGDGIYQLHEELQKDIDEWILENPTYNILSQSIALNKQEALLTVHYTVLGFIKN